MHKKVLRIVRVAVTAALLAVCSWVSIPFPVPITMQTFGVFLALTACGGVEGTLGLLVYIALGAVGVPVFAGFSGGVSALFGPTGGYIFGFLLTGGAKLLFEKLFGRTRLELPALALGLLLCYACGTAWFMFIMNSRGGDYTLGSALMTCVVPFILPDAAKLALGSAVGRRLRPVIGGQS